MSTIYFSQDRNRDSEIVSASGWLRRVRPFVVTMTATTTLLHNSDVHSFSTRLRNRDLEIVVTGDQVGDGFHVMASVMTLPAWRNNNHHSCSELQRPTISCPWKS